jgi:hypothetical protein
MVDVFAGFHTSIKIILLEAGIGILVHVAILCLHSFSGLDVYKKIVS